MPIRLPSDLPAFSVLQDEGVMVMSRGQADRQDIRPLHIALLNLMPKKIQTENQFARLIGATPIQIELHLMQMSHHTSKNTAQDHMQSFYRTFEEVEASGDKFDGLIITGAPIEHLDFQDVSYWDELTRIFEWSQSHVAMTMGVCWGAMALINHMSGVSKHHLDAKAFGCYRHENMEPKSPYLRGFSDDLVVPVSRWTEMRQNELEAAGLDILVTSPDVGPALAEDKARRILYNFNHLEYDTGTLGEEYKRDAEAGEAPQLPVAYYPNDDPSETPRNRWRGHAHLLFGNWINEIYQLTPYDRAQIGATPLTRQAET
jgi:homoserine O-succinyltransferase